MASDTGTLYPGTVTTSASAPYVDNDWSDPTFVMEDDTNYASITAASFDTGAQSYLMSARQFGATVPGDGTITGVQVEIGKYYAVGAARDALVTLGSSGVPQGNNLGSLADNWPTTAPGTIFYGGSTELWGMTITPSLVNSANFGVLFAGSAAGNNCDSFVDFIRMVVYYNAPVSQWDITPAEATQAQISDAAPLVTIYNLIPAENEQPQVSDAAPLAGIYSTSPAEATQAQTSDAAAISAVYVVSVADATQTQAVDAATVTVQAAYSPQTGLLDDFNRADESPMNSNWGNPFSGAQGAWKIVDQQATPVG